MREGPPTRPVEWTPAALFKVGFFLELGLVLVAAGIGLAAFQAPFPFQVRIDGTDLLRALGATAPMVVMALVLTSPAGRRIRALERIYVRVREVLGRPLRGLAAADLFLLAGAAGVGEEILFRGVLQPLMGLWPSSLVFGLLHALTPTYFVLASLMGAYLGWLFAATGNLLVPIVVHWLYDAAALHLLRRRFLSDPEVDGEGGAEPPGTTDVQARSGPSGNAGDPDGVPPQEPQEGSGAGPREDAPEEPPESGGTDGRMET